ncbi:DNA polymerase delta, subunit 4-domain-containing protein [Leptodontidium sp. MPI-SDFR-AT-0119]|nr:DNA polymerase delta, subunit 4-domain-containing protein [Leptodontidium sp. MPI-SDFR-AT-0119]
MPPSRRTRPSSGPGPAAKGAQKTLSFGTKVTKPAAALPYIKDEIKDVSSPSVTAKAKAHPLSNTIDLNVELEPKPELEKEEEGVEVGLDTEHVGPSAAGVGKGEGESKSEEVQKAEKVTDAQIRKYWREREGERVTKRVHQEELGVEEKILRLFDMSSQFGPAIGIARMKRWSRAHKLGLKPPIEVLAVLLQEEKKGNEKIERAYVDELMSSKFVVGDAA